MTDHFYFKGAVLIIDHLFPSELMLPNTGDEAVVGHDHISSVMKSFPLTEGFVNVGDSKGSSGIQSMTRVHRKLINTANPLDLFQLTVPTRTM